MWKVQRINNSGRNVKQRCVRMISAEVLAVYVSARNFAAWISQLSSAIVWLQIPVVLWAQRTPVISPVPAASSELVAFVKKLLTLMLSTCKKVNNICRRLRLRLRLRLLTIEVAFRTPASSVCQVPFGVCSRHNYLQHLEIYTNPSELIHQTAIRPPAGHNKAKQVISIRDRAGGKLQGRSP